MCRVHNPSLESVQGEAGKCKKARVQNWLEEIDKQQQCRLEKTTTKRVKEVKEQEKDKNISPREEEADFVHHPGRDRRGTAGEEQQMRKSLEEAHIKVRKRPPKQEEHQREGNGTTKSSQGRQAEQQGKPRQGH